MCLLFYSYPVSLHIYIKGQVCAPFSHSCGDCITSHRFHGQRFDRHDVLNGHRSQHRAKVERLDCQVVGLHRCKVVISDVQHVLQKKAKSDHPVLPSTA